MCGEAAPGSVTALLQRPPVRRWPQRDERNVADVTDDSVDVGEGEVSDL